MLLSEHFVKQARRMHSERYGSIANLSSEKYLCGAFTAQRTLIRRYSKYSPWHRRKVTMLIGVTLLVSICRPGATGPSVGKIK